MKKYAFNHNSSCQSSARTAEFFSCHTSNNDFLKGTIIIVSFLLCLIIVMLMVISKVII